MKQLVLFLFLFTCNLLAAQKQVDTIVVESPSMNVSIKNIVILPENYGGQKAFPVLYLLHGYSGHYDSWLSIKPELPELATEKGLIIVCPDGKNNWYWDSPVNPEVRYETYISKELVSYIDQHYKTVRDRKGRAVTGLSMGGHGGLWLGIRHQDVFGACGSTSGGVDIRPFPNNWEMKKQLGDYKDNPERWDAHTVMTQLNKIQPDSLAIIIDCGTEDFFYNVNEKLHNELLYRNIKHDYITRPGAHNSAYWKNSIDYQILFFSTYFSHCLNSTR
ncbi:alpha/beta hydrolase family protein [Parabacteroides sp. Marseille-P3160]|uniref:alpha/beta hydrolase n=1 Tax=Parabacteroides sp. Marseille-P3160 TaxID=1917887 RepID=UPI0009BAA5EC|nr:alpha/beta hydrolase family protein [Parabacteroides sp. Marseille-P3160]